MLICMLMISFIPHYYSSKRLYSTFTMRRHQKQKKGHLTERSKPGSVPNCKAIMDALATVTFLSDVPMSSSKDPAQSSVLKSAAPFPSHVSTK
mmetsp:Transcript_33396/g.54179  ORF Transcript_33396/g.54179 Transcript_33396/m.54179 type:complete len:93 (-) Transcript_33396:2391-2669(-)